MHDDLSALYAYNRWADDRIVQAARQLTPEQYVQEPVPGWASVRATLVHLADATEIWSRRLRGESIMTRAAETDLPTIDDVAQLFAKAHDAFDQIAPTLTPERLKSTFSYRNFQGQDKKAPLWAVMRHVVNHATYHRGQVVSKLKRLGVEAPPTDLVFWAIEQTSQD